MKKIYPLLFILFFTNLFYGAQAQTPDCTTNLSPLNAITNVDPYPKITLKWQPVANATSYDVYISTKIPPKQLLGTTTSDSINLYDASYNTTYYWYVAPKNADGAATGCISNVTSFTTIPPPPPPSNDNCTGAAYLSSSPLTGTTLGATQSQPADICNGYTGTANDDIWYQFTPSENGTIVISLQGNGSFDGVLEAFSGDCGSLTSLSCSDSSQSGGREQLTLNVISGTNYKVRLYNFYSTLSTRGTFSISATGAALPVTLLSFKGEHQQDKNILRWSTAQEQNNQGFEVQYSLDGNNFNPLSFVNSKAVNGNSSSILSYEFADVRPIENLYYRLKQIDKDGRSDFSNVIYIKGEKNAEASYNIFPNPAKNLLNITISSASANKIKLGIKDLAGRTMMQENKTLMKGANRLVINLSSLASGTYYLSADSENGTPVVYRQFVKE